MLFVELNVVNADIFLLVDKEILIMKTKKTKRGKVYNSGNLEQLLVDGLKIVAIIALLAMLIGNF